MTKAKKQDVNANLISDLLRAKGTLVTINVAVYTGTKLSPALLEEAVSQHILNPDDVGRASIFTIDQELVKPISQSASRLRAIWRQYTLPWSRSVRFLPNKLFAKFSPEWEAELAVFEQAVGDLMAGYEKERDQDAVKRLGPFYDASLYKHKHVLRDCYAASWEPAQVTDPRDFGSLSGVLDSSELDSMVERLQQDHLTRAQAAQEDGREQLRDFLNRVVEQCADQVEGESKKRIYDSLHTAAIEMAERCPEWNLLDDPVITKIAAQVGDLVPPNPKQVLNEDADLRRKVAGKAASLLKGMNLAG